jgi:hypothetical protein
MNNRPVHENLDTSFVNLYALVRYLRRRQFVGRVRLELNSYEADIVLLEGNKISVREHDKISGRIAEGEEALQRLLIRAREPGGTIHVYQSLENSKNPNSEKLSVSPVQTSGLAELPKASPPPASQPTQNGLNGLATSPAKAADILSNIPPKINRLKLPFELKNSVEEKARQHKIAPQEWQMLLNLTGELLGTIDKTLSEAKLDFKAAFSKSRLEISPDYPFLHPSAIIFDYTAGRITMKEQVTAKLYTAGINEALRRILEKLGANPKFSEVYRHTVQKILALINQRKSFYEKFFITPQLQKIIGAK